MLAQNSTIPQERRARNRARSFKHAKLILDGNNSVFDGVLKNVSAYGATIAVDLSETLPERFNLHIVHDNITVPCQVKWRRPNTLGVAF